MIKLTARDWNLLIGIYDNTLLSFKQIQSHYFTIRSKAVVHNRLSKLIKSQMIDRFKLGRILHHEQCADIGVVYRISKLGLKLLQMQFKNKEFSSHVVTINSSSLFHDLLLSDVMLKLKSGLVDKKLVHGKLFLNQSNLKRQPDAVVICDGTNEKMAIELELTAKSDIRYRQLLMQYRLSTEFEKVLYITSNLAIQRKIKSVLGIKNVQGVGEINSSKFTFINLEDLLKGETHASQIKI